MGSECESLTKRGHNFITANNRLKLSHSIYYFKLSSVELKLGVDGDSDHTQVFEDCEPLGQTYGDNSDGSDIDELMANLISTSILGYKSIKNFVSF